MTDISDVQKKLIETLARTLVPDVATYGSQYAPSTVIVDGEPVPLRILRGSPNPAELDREIAAPFSTGCIITVNPEPGMSRHTASMLRHDWRETCRVALTVTLTVSTNVVTVSGLGSAGQVVGINYGLNEGWSHRCEGVETAEEIASALAALIPGASVVGAQLTLDATGPVIARVAGDATMVRELGQLSQAFRIDVYAPNDKVRDKVSAMLAPIMAGVRALAFDDGSFSSMISIGPSWTDDQTQKAGVWKRWQRVDLSFPITETAVHPAILHLSLNIDHSICG